MTLYRALPLALLVWLPTALPAAEDAGVAFFEQKIRPVLVEHCYRCHSQDAKETKGGLLLDTREGLRKGGETGQAIVPGKPGESLLLEALRHESLEMPPDKRLPDRVIADFEKWIKLGAADPRDGKSDARPQAGIDWASARKFWSFRPPRRQPTPAVHNPAWPYRKLDYFVLARLDAAGLKPSDEADRRTLIRRLSFDLTGLPPGPEGVETFLADTSPQAYERLVDRLLASPHYGERWARLWLDVARYAEDQAHIVGSNSSLFYPNAYLYRDWVIESLNGDMPYDRFVQLQLAADHLEPKDSPHHVALGFLGLGPKYYRRNDPEVMADEWDDRVDTVTRGLLGLTVACARCHDHKFDPISTADYYALAGVFASTQMYNRPLSGKQDKNKDGQAKKPADAAHIVRDRNARDLPVYIRGNVKTPGPPAPRRFLTVLCDDEPTRFQQGSGRRELAAAIVDRGNPLAARVIVNRVWGIYFGRPLVATASNFGSLGERPSHPRLLDDLAVRFMDSGWSLKWLHREIVSSATYRQTSLSDAGRATDPDNRLLWRMNRRRLPVESWRDALLVYAGQLSTAIGGKSIQPQAVKERRRTVYSRISRLDLDGMLALFDFPDPNAHSAGRSRTTTPLQKLFVMNNPFAVHQAERLATRLLAERDDDSERIQYAHALLYGRSATDDEVQLATEFLSAAEGSTQQRWAQYAQVLLAANETMMID